MISLFYFRKESYANINLLNKCKTMKRRPAFRTPTIRQEKNLRLKIQLNLEASSFVFHSLRFWIALSVKCLAICWVLFQFIVFIVDFPLNEWNFPINDFFYSLSRRDIILPFCIYLFEVLWIFILPAKDVLLRMLLKYLNLC